jgi:glycosyltransferase involved in cell wall biosynthesis
MMEDNYPNQTNIPAACIDHGNCGLLVPVGNAAALAQAMKTLLIDEALRKRLVANGSERVQEFSSQRMAQRYINLYSTLLAGSCKCRTTPTNFGNDGIPNKVSG